MGKVIKLPEREDPLAPARGVIVGLLLSITLYLVIFELWEWLS